MLRSKNTSSRFEDFKMNDALHSLLSHYRDQVKTEREKGTYFESLIRAYLYTGPLGRVFWWFGPYGDWNQGSAGPHDLGVTCWVITQLGYECQSSPIYYCRRI